VEALINGPQRKVMTSWVRPARSIHGETGIPVRSGKTLPFVVHREWSAPAGYYPEQWFLVMPVTREVVYEGPVRQLLVWGLQSLTPVEDRVVEPHLDLLPGKYLIVFSLGGIKGGELEVEAIEVPAEEAA
jgi:hypothetical protein